MSIDLNKLEKLDREEQISIYRDIGSTMMEKCIIPNVLDLANLSLEKDEKSKNLVKNICEYTDNYDDIIESVMRRDDRYNEDESRSFMNKVIAANINEITDSGYFYKKMIAACDNLKISRDVEDCQSGGYEVRVEDISEEFFNYKIKTHYINELNCYIEDYNKLIGMCKACRYKTIHVRNFLTCNLDDNHKCFCQKCAGIYRRSKYDTFIPYNIGIYSTLAITEHATQASLDSMNNGVTAPLNVVLEKKFDLKYTYEEVIKLINDVIDEIGDVGVFSKYYELALLSRLYKDKDYYRFSSLKSALHKQGDDLGSFIYNPNKERFKKLINSSGSKASSLKSKTLFDIFE